MLALAVAMGIGRFSFTPIMPLMLEENIISLKNASWLASINYFGYLLGAIVCSLQFFLAKFFKFKNLNYSKIISFGLVTTCLLIVLMSLNFPLIWPILRFLSGFTTAIVFVLTSTWCLNQLSVLNAQNLGGIVYAGPGMGILISGITSSVLVQYKLNSQFNWVILGLLSLVITFLILPLFKTKESFPFSKKNELNIYSKLNSNFIVFIHTIAYGLAGFGYIITATFLPVFARISINNSIWADLFWPIFGVGATLGALISSKIPEKYDQKYVLAFCYLIQAFGIFFSNNNQTVMGYSIGSFLIGLPFTVITFYAMRFGRELNPKFSTSIIGILTTSFGICQILGPITTAYLVNNYESKVIAFEKSLNLAILSLVLGASLYIILAQKK